MAVISLPPTLLLASGKEPLRIPFQANLTDPL